MGKNLRKVVYDTETQIEACYFKGIVKPFPNHFHEYYVIGLVEKGERRLLCQNNEYAIKSGDILVFNPGDNHACAQSGNEKFCYGSFNISKEIICGLMEEITGERQAPEFSENVIRGNEKLVLSLSKIHKAIMEGGSGYEKKKNLIQSVSSMIKAYGQSSEYRAARRREEIEKVCGFIDAHYGERICLEGICRFAGLSKSTLLREFTRIKGITPYRYLEAIRINKAKILLKKGILPAEAALMTGFSDQSHLTNSFNNFIGFSPGEYREIFLKKDKK